MVAKLFGATIPDVAVFGQKDYQQLAIVRRMVADLDMGIDVVGVPTIREPDGLARSSRNVALVGRRPCGCGRDPGGTVGGRRGVRQWRA